MAPFSEIHSPDNPRVKRAVRLRNSRHRRKQGRLLIDGLREIRRALHAGIQFEEVFLRESAVELQGVVQLIEEIRTSTDAKKHTSFAVLRDAVFAKVSFGDRDEGMVVVAEAPRQSLETFHEAVSGKQNPLVGVLEGVEKPGNVGAVFRSADGAGLDGLFLAHAGTDLFNPNTLRASCGTLFALPFAAAASREILDYLAEQEMQIVVARVEGSDLYTNIDYRRPTAIVLGSEAEGLSSLWSGEKIHPVHLPMLGVADSLNVSVAASILFYEARRQRRGESKPIE